MLKQLETERLLIRTSVASDAAELAIRRSNPTLAEFQNWSIPYTLQQAIELLANNPSWTDKTDGQYHLIVCDKSNGASVGDFAVGLSNDGRTAEIGYSLNEDAWGNEYAAEAAAAVVAYLFTSVGVSRIKGSIHPDNVASARVLEQAGLTFEGDHALAYWVDDNNTDDRIYGMTRAGWEAWRTRPSDHPSQVDFAEISAQTVDSVLALRTHETQTKFVSPMSVSFGHAMFSGLEKDGFVATTWMRAIHADDQLVGFVMMAQPNQGGRSAYLWRLLIDRMHQRRGIGQLALALVIEQARLWGASDLTVHWCEGPGSPAPLYLNNGFVPTGKIIDGETEAQLAL